jgi:hypothetical protein
VIVVRLTVVRLTLVTVAVAMVFAAGTARADVGIETVSRGMGSPGEKVTVDVGCGFCYPPCRGPRGERHPAGREHGACMLGNAAPPPRRFPISLIAMARVPRVLGCRHGYVCPAGMRARAPTRPPFHYLGAATQPGDDARGLPRYVLRFAIPDLQPGLYAYALYCGVCWRGTGGGLISWPAASTWRLRVVDPPASASWGPLFRLPW